MRRMVDLFVRKGDNLTRPAKLTPRKSLLSGSTDWKLLVDYFDRPIVFPLRYSPQVKGRT